MAAGLFALALEAHLQYSRMRLLKEVDGIKYAEEVEDLDLWAFENAWQAGYSYPDAPVPALIASESVLLTAWNCGRGDAESKADRGEWLAMEAEMEAEAEAEMEAANGYYYV